VSRTWAELLGDEAAGPQESAEAGGFFSRLRDSLGKSRRALTEQIAAGTFDAADDAAWERLEEALIAADVGVPSTAELVRRLEARGELGDLSEALVEETAALLGEPGRLSSTGTERDPRRRRQRHRQDDDDRQAREPPARAWAHGRARRRRHLRAAAEEQLEIWAERAGADFVGGERGGDPAAVAYDAIELAAERGRDVVIVDTAGRLHTQANLMEELAKVRRVIAQKQEGAPNETLLVVDATTGQNGVQQARLFGEAVGVTASR
jgi:fused signal recognition particle receptor